MEIQGFTYGFDGRYKDFRSEAGVRSQELLYQTGVNWVCLAFAAVVDTPVSTEIHTVLGRMPSDRDIAAVVRRAHEHSVKVCLKPMVNCLDGTWRARIQFPDMGEGEEDIYWNRWFDNYSRYMLYYGELAEELGCEMLCIGCEMCGTEKKEGHWRTLIEKLRKVYSGLLVYNTNHGHEDAVKWFDAVDFLGTSAYFPVAEFHEEPRPYESLVAEMKENWTKVSEQMEAFHKKWGKPLLFMEIGCRSARGCASMPWDFSHPDLPTDELEQAAFYESVLDTFADKSWFAGLFFWDWSTFIYDTKEQAKQNNWFNIHLKKAETVVRERFTNPE